MNSSTASAASLRTPVRSRQDKPQSWTVHWTPEPDSSVTPEDSFLQTLCLERKRAERSGKHFLLMLLEGDSLVGRAPVLTAALRECTRETDLSGWYRQGSTLGVIFTEVEASGAPTAEDRLNARVEAALRARIGRDEMERIRLSFHLFPEAKNPGGWSCSEDSALYPDVRHRKTTRPVLRLVKRMVDVAGSAAALIVLSPVLALIAAAIKLTSKGPVLYRQVRIGQFGKPFTFLKFRSMYVNSSASLHREYVKGLIQGNGKAQTGKGASSPIYKITRDPRVTPLGAWLRRSSLDELPQFINVLKGDMSLVGPRPPIPYELEDYDAWHRRRLLESQPGVTGLWQVSGRCRTTFDEMVRLDLRYAQQWSVWLDLQILARTPGAVISGDGAC